MENIKKIDDFQNFTFNNLPIHLKILKINEIIQNFPDERKIDVCENCRNKIGDFKQYNNFIQDTNICSICFTTNDVLNYSIVELVEKAGLKAEEFYNYVGENKAVYNGLRCSNSHREMQIKKNEIILNEEDFKNKLRELEEKYSSFLDPFVYNREENFRQNLKRYFERCKKLFYKDIRQKNNKLYIIEYKSLCDKYYH
jgi:hypothetical protein